MAATASSHPHVVSRIDLTASRGALELKEFELVRFASGSRVLVISDVAAASRPGGSDRIEASVAVSIGCGSFYDSERSYSGHRLEGRAHLTEHLLFMGSEPFPEENDYERFLSEHGGDCNAYTDAEATCFYLNVRSSALSGAMDRLVAAISKPLLRPETVKREVMAVESEFQQAKLSNLIRSEQVMVHAAFREDHPASVFLWGNHKSLVSDPLRQGFSARDDVEAYFRKEYRPDRMHGVVRAPLPLPELRELVLASFEPVAAPSSTEPEAAARGHAPKDPASAPKAADTWTPTWGGASPVREGILPSICRWKPVNDRLALALTWMLPPVIGWWRGCPVEYVSHCLGHEGRGSLLSHLRAQGVAASLSAGVNEGGLDNNSLFCCFEVAITLTAAGAERWEEVVESVFAYLSMLRGAGPQSMIWDELQAVAKLAYDNAHDESPEDQVQRLAASMARDSDPGNPLGAQVWLQAADPGLLAPVSVTAEDLGFDGKVPEAELLTASQVPSLPFERVFPRISVLLAALSPRSVFVTIACTQFQPSPEAAAELSRSTPSTAKPQVAAATRSTGDAEGTSDGDEDDDDDDDDGEDSDRDNDGDEDSDDGEEDRDTGAEPLSAAALASLSSGELTSIEPWFATAYRVDAVPESVLRSWLAPTAISVLQLPAHNKYIPKELPVHPLSDPDEWHAEARLDPSDPVIQAMGGGAGGIPAPASSAPVSDSPSTSASASASASTSTSTSATPVAALLEGVAGAASEGRRLPALLSEGDSGRLWWLQGTEQRLPRTMARCMLYLQPLRERAKQDDAEALACAHMWALLAYDMAQEEAYEASMAELFADLHLRYSNRALHLQVEGFSPCIARLLGVVLDALRAVAEAEATPELESAFQRLREVSRRRVAASGVKPIAHAQGERLRVLLGQQATTRDTQLAGLDTVELHDVLGFARQMTSERLVFNEMLVAGNETAESARALFATVQSAAIVAGPHAAESEARASSSGLEVLCAERLLSGGGCMPEHSVVKLPGSRSGPMVFRSPPRRADETNAAAVLYYQVDAPRRARTVALLQLVEALMEEPLFDRLRTQEQLGYVVQCEIKCTLGVAGFSISLQGSRFSCEHLTARAVDFVKWWITEFLPALKSERFDSTRKALASSMLQPPATTEDAADAAWDSLESAQFDFGLDIAAAHILQSLTIEDVIGFARTWLLAPGTRRLLIVQIGSTIKAPELLLDDAVFTIPEEWYTSERSVMIEASQTAE